MDVDNLENALNEVTDSNEVEAKSGMSVDEEIGFHKGALNTLVAERNELVKMIGNVETIAGVHAKRLKELGVGNE
jgi:hypothetical protein